jgi:toxin CptA
MSIAVSAVVGMPLCLRLLLTSFGVLAIVFGLMMGSAPLGYAWPLSGAGASILAGLILIISLLKNRDLHRIDISGVGEIRLTVYRYTRSIDIRDWDARASSNSFSVELMAGSTLWPGLLLLRLRAEDGGISVVPVFVASVGATVFRPLAVACRAIAARDATLS